MLLIGKDTLKVLEARFELKNNIDFLGVLEISWEKCCPKVVRNI